MVAAAMVVAGTAELTVAETAAALEDMDSRSPRFAQFSLRKKKTKNHKDQIEEKSKRRGDVGRSRVGDGSATQLGLV
eukprot:6205452-Pleurochrysis_carterae.AAC.1